MNTRNRKRSRHLLAAALGAALTAPLAIAAPQGLTGAVGGQVGVPVPQPRLPTQPVERAVDRTADALQRTQERADAAGRDAGDAMSDPASATVQGAAQAAVHSEVAQRETWARLDADGDGRISTSEAAADAALDASFGTTDTNHDGFIDVTEYSTHAQAAVSQGAEHAVDHSAAVQRELWMQLDADGDARISAAEAEADAGFAASFEAMDDDADGFVTPDERREHARSERDPGESPRDQQDQRDRK